jgi:hypothetical protein
MLQVQSLVSLVESNADQLAKRCVSVAKSHPATPTYHDYDEGELYERAFSVYSQLGKWLSDETTKDDIREVYTALGAQRRREGFALSEVIQALIITRRVLWWKVENEGFLDTALDLHLALRLSNRTILFFDRAILAAAQGYES